MTNKTYSSEDKREDVLFSKVNLDTFDKNLNKTFIMYLFCYLFTLIFGLLFYFFIYQL
jgi:hypothetical protein